MVFEISRTFSLTKLRTVVNQHPCCMFLFALCLSQVCVYRNELSQFPFFFANVSMVQFLHQRRIQFNPNKHDFLVSICERSIEFIVICMLQFDQMRSLYLSTQYKRFSNCKTNEQTIVMFNSCIFRRSLWKEFVMETNTFQWLNCIAVWTEQHECTTLW